MIYVVFFFMYLVHFYVPLLGKSLPLPKSSILPCPWPPPSTPIRLPIILFCENIILVILLSLVISTVESWRGKVWSLCQRQGPIKVQIETIEATLTETKMLLPQVVIRVNLLFDIFEKSSKMHCGRILSHVAA